MKMERKEEQENLILIEDSRNLFSVYERRQIV